LKKTAALPSGAASEKYFSPERAKKFTKAQLRCRLFGIEAAPANQMPKVGGKLPGRQRELSGKSRL
jgi:hypothetical protein